MGDYYCYLRISTKEERGKQGYSRQEKALESYARKNHVAYQYGFDFRDDESGKSFDNRKEWQKLEKIVSAGDTIVFKDICRFTREAENGYNKYMWLMEKGVNLIFLDNMTVSTDYIKKLLNIAETQDLIARESTKFIAKILLIAELDRAEKERLSISQRTRDGMAARKKQAEENGLEWHCGRKKGKLDKMSDSLRSDIVEYQSNRAIKQVDLMRKYHISRNTLKKYVKIVQMQTAQMA